MAHNMANYAYYADAYMGSLIPQREFAPLARKAEAYLQQLCRTFLVEGGEDAKAMAVCAMAEELYRGAAREGIASTSIGGVQVQYRADGKLWQQMYRAASIYLDIYRGKELCKGHGLSHV